MAIKTVLILPDLHCPHQDEQAVESVCKLARYIKPSHVVLLGDVIEGAGVSTHIKDSIAERATTDLLAEFDVFNALFDRVTKYSGEVLLTLGNHDERINRYADEHPEVAKLIKFERCFELDARRKSGKKIKLCKYNEALNIGKLWFTHGTYTGDTAAKKMVLAYQRSICFGHTHTYGSHTWTSPIDVRDKHTAYNLGCLCNINPGFMKNRPSAWVHMCGVAYIRDDGSFNMYPVGVFGGRLVFNGKEFSS